jgi:hypothetical protein
MPCAVDVVPATLRSLDDHAGDVLVLTAFADERPLAGLAGLVDWRLRGALSEWMMNGFATGHANERVLYPTRGRLNQRFVLMIGLGARAQHRADRARAAAFAATSAVSNLGLTSMICGSFGLETLPAPLERSLPELIERVREQTELSQLRFAVDSPGFTLR